MAQLTIRDLYDLLSQAPRRRDLEQDGIRLVYDGKAVHGSSSWASRWTSRFTGRGSEKAGRSAARRSSGTHDCRRGGLRGGSHGSPP